MPVGAGLALHAAAQTGDSTAQPATLTLQGPARIAASARIAPGSYPVTVPAGQAAIEIDADIDNHIEGSKHDGIAIEHGSGNFLIRNQILKNGGVGIRLFRRQPVPDPSRDYVILEDRIEGNRVGALLNQTHDVTITGNVLADNGMGIKAEKGSTRVRLQANPFSPGTGKSVETDADSKVEE